VKGPGSSLASKHVNATHRTLHLFTGASFLGCKRLSLARGTRPSAVEFSVVRVQQQQRLRRSLWRQEHLRTSQCVHDLVVASDSDRLHRSRNASGARIREPTKSGNLADVKRTRGCYGIGRATPFTAKRDKSTAGCAPGRRIGIVDASKQFH
jgi:hypothetical protein